MQLRPSILAIAGLLACSPAEDEPTSMTESSTGLQEPESEVPSASDPGTSVTTTSSTGGGTGVATTTSGAATDPSGGETTGGLTSSDEAETSATESGNEDTGEAETAAPETGGDEGPSAECSELEACCNEIGSDLYAGCSTVVQMANPDLCDSILGTYHQEGYCTGETFCAELGECCAELPPGPGWQDTCEYYADFGNQPQCAMLIGDYQLSDYCQ